MERQEGVLSPSLQGAGVTSKSSEELRPQNNAIRVFAGKTGAHWHDQHIPQYSVIRLAPRRVQEGWPGRWGEKVDEEKDFPLISPTLASLPPSKSLQLII